MSEPDLASTPERNSDSELAYDSDQALAEAKEILADVDTDGPIINHGTGDVLFELVESMERFTTERIVLIAKKLKLEEDLVIQIITANLELARASQRRIGDGKRRRYSRKPKSHIANSLSASGLI
jgi:hypothetical protein